MLLVVNLTPKKATHDAVAAPGNAIVTCVGVSNPVLEIEIGLPLDPVHVGVLDSVNVWAGINTAIGAVMLRVPIVVAPVALN